jgi:outer membrane receptor protein involved in Fe transport
MGLKTATRIIRNEFGLQEQNAEGNWESFPAFTNNLVYTERIHAAYLMASNRFRKLSVQAGLRGEYTDITTELTVTNEVRPRNYFNLFPSASLSYALRQNKTAQLSYSYRISRPNFRNLLPFSDFRDSRVFFIGNPNLRPEYTHSFEVGYLLDWKSGSILTSLYHRHRTDVIQRIVSDVDSAGRTRIVPINMAKENAYGFEFNLSLTVKDWWKINSSTNFYRAITDGEYEGEQLHSDTYTWSTRTTSKLTLLKTWNFQTSLNYRAPRITTQGKNLSMYSVDLGLSRDLLKGKLTVTANVRDLFNTRKRRSVVDREGYYSRSEFQWQRRQWMITLTYRINRENRREDEEERERDSDDDGDGDY